MKKQYFLSILFFYTIAVFYLATTTPISPHEAKILYTSHDFVSLLMKWGKMLLPVDFLGLRIFFVFFGFLSVGFFHLLSQRYFSKAEDGYLATSIFMLLPGILTASTLANVSIIVLPLVLLFVLLYEKGYFFSLPLIMLALFFIHEASIIFFIALLLYGSIHRDKKLTISSSAFLIAFVFLSKGIEIGGRPTGHFVEIFGLYAAVFSPLLFFYFFYAMYRILLREKKTLLWYISFTALAFSLLLSIRQRIYITDFAPYVTISIISMLDVFNRSIKVRLPEFRKRYKTGFKVVLFSLVVSTFVILFHQWLFYKAKEPEKHFAKRIYIPYILANKLKSEGKDCYRGTYRRERYQLRYYGLLPCFE